MRKFFSRPIRVGKGKRRFQLLSPSMIIFVLLILALLVGTYYSFGPPSRAAGDAAGPSVRALTATVATINSQPITRRDYELQLLIAERRMAQHIDPTQMRFVKTAVLQSMIDEHLKLEAIRRERIRVSAREIEEEKDRLVEQNLSERYPTTKDLRDHLQRRRISLEELREQIRQALPDDNLIRMQLQLDRLREQVQSVVTLSDEQLQDSFTEVQARHILISPDAIIEKAALERQAESEGDEEAIPEAVMSEEEANQKAGELAAELMQKLQAGDEFAKLAAEYSDDPGSAADGGDLGWFRKGRMIAEFEQAAFATEPGQLAGPVETAFGFHIIKVEDRRASMPDDFEQNREMYREQTLFEARERAWREYEQQLHEQAAIEIVDPELKAYEALDRGNVVEGLRYLEEAVASDAENISAAYELARVYEDMGLQDRAIAALEKVAVSETGATSARVHLKLGEMLVAAGQKDKALASFKAASDWARAYTHADYMIHIQLLQLLEELGETELAAQEQEWIDGYTEHQKTVGGPDAMPFTVP